MVSSAAMVDLCFCLSLRWLLRKNLYCVQVQISRERNESCATVLTVVWSEVQDGVVESSHLKKSQRGSFILAQCACANTQTTVF